jgi:small-conductance mechanosensitive channel
MRLTESTGWVAVQEWLTLYGMPIRIIAIVFAAIIMRWIVLVVLQRTVQRVVNGVKKNQQVESTREIVQSPLLAARIVQRTRTLGSVGTNLVTSLIAIVVLVLVLGELGVNLTAILASAGIIAAGLAFGAQNIVKDLLGGIFMVFEDQLGVGDSVVIGEVRGTVEMVGLRITHVRASDGTLWFIRNGEILKLGNLSHDWGRAQIDLTVAATQPLEEVQQIALEAAGELHRDPLVARKIIGLAEVIGLREVTPEKVTLRLAIKTRPGVQDEVGRALSAVLLRRFDGAGIPLALQPIEGGTT